MVTGHNLKTGMNETVDKGCFDNSTNPFMHMFDQLSDDSKKQYKAIGEYMYSIVDFETSEVIDKRMELQKKNEP